MKIVEAINALKQYYKTRNREDIEIEGELRLEKDGEVILSAPKSFPKVGVKFSSDQENKVRELTTANRTGLAKDTDSDPKLGRDKGGDGK